MMMKDFDSTDMPLWLQRYWERIQYNAVEGMKAENEQYQMLHKECERLEEYNKFISKIIEGDAVTEPFPLTEGEVKTLSSFLRLKADSNELEEMNIYLTGCRDMYYMLRIMKVIN